MPASLLGLGGGMIINGLLNALVSSINSRKTIAENKLQQQKNLEFQEALQKKQWKHAERLQREMRKVTRDNFLEQLEFQKQSGDLQALEQRWPIPAISPRLVINEFNEYLSSGIPIPLQLIVVENGDLSKGGLSIKQQVRDAINELNKFMSTYYGQNSLHAVKIHDSCKTGSYFGSSEVDTVYQVFKVAPTIVLTARVSGSKYIQECWQWGISGKKPTMVELFKCDVEELQLSILNQIAADWSTTKEKFQLQDPDKDLLVDLLGRIEEKVKNLKEKGAPHETLREYGYRPFAPEIEQFISLSPRSVNKERKVNAAPFIKSINDGIANCILSSYKICASLLSDSHFLLEYSASPRFMKICADELRVFPQLMNQADAFFDKMLECAPEHLRKDVPLMHARLALAYQEAKQVEKTLKYSRKCTRLLEQMVEPHQFELMASDDMKQCLDVLSEIDEIRKEFPWVASRSSKEVSPDELNHHAVDLYSKGKREEAITVWKGAVEQGHKKSMHNLAVVLDAEKRVDEANEMYAIAISNGVKDLYKKGHQLALWYCNRKKWSDAIRMWCIYLQSGDEEFFSEAVADSSILFFTKAISEICKEALQRWAALVRLRLEYVNTFETFRAEVVDLLFSKVKEGSLSDKQKMPYYNVLSAWYIKSRDKNIHLIDGVACDIELEYRVPNNLSPKMDNMFKEIILNSSRLDIRNYHH